MINQKDNISRLIASLDNSKFAITNNPLYQTILGLIRITRGFNNAIISIISDINILNQPKKSIELPVETLFSTAVNVNPSTLLGYGTWTLFATGVGVSGDAIVITKI